MHTLKVIYLDGFNKVIPYIEEAGSDVSSLTCNYYYDYKQILLFVFITGGVFNGSVLEHRIYFNSKGQKIFKIQSYTKG